MIYVVCLIIFVISWLMPMFNLSSFNLLVNITPATFFSISFFTVTINICLILLTYWSGKNANKFGYKYSNFKQLFNTFYLFLRLSSDFFLLFPLLSGNTPQQILIESTSKIQFFIPLFFQFLFSIFLISELYFGIKAASYRFLSWLNASSSNRFE